MAGPHDDVGIEQFRTLATEWRRVRHLSGLRASLPSGPAQARLATLSEISQSSGTWKLAVAAAAYAVLRPPAVLPAGAGTNLAVVVSLLETLPGRSKLPAFADVAGVTTAVPMSALLRQAPRLRSILLRSGPLTAASMACVAFCLSQHSNDPDGFLQCMLEC